MISYLWQTAGFYALCSTLSMDFMIVFCDIPSPAPTAGERDAPPH